MGDALAWRPISEAPTDGQIIWAYLYDSGIRAVRYLTPEEAAENEGGEPDDYEGGWAEIHDDNEWWLPRWWLPYSAFPEPSP